MRAVNNYSDQNVPSIFSTKSNMAEDMRRSSAVEDTCTRSWIQSPVPNKTKAAVCLQYELPNHIFLCEDLWIIM